MGRETRRESFDVGTDTRAPIGGRVGSPTALAGTIGTSGFGLE